MTTLHIESRDGATTRTVLAAGEGPLPDVAVDTAAMAWVDVEAPGEREWEWLAQAFGFHPLAIEDARRQGQRAKVDAYDTHLFLSLPVPGPADTESIDFEAGVQELDVFVARGLLVTVHPHPLPMLAQVASQRRAAGPPGPHRAGHMLHRLLDTLVDDFQPWMDRLDTAIDTLESAAHDESTSPNLGAAVRLRKQLLLLRQTCAPVRDVANHLLRIDHPTLEDPALVPFLQDVYDHTLRLVEQVDLHRDILGNVVDLMMAQTSNRLNGVMKTMTSISTILMSDALIAGVYGMNFKHMPELGWVGGYFACLGAMAVLSAGLAWHFKRIGWL